MYCKLSHLLLLGLTEVIDRLPLAAGTGFHFNSSELSCDGGNQIEFAAAHPEIARNDGGTAVLQKAGSDSFTKGSETAKRQRAELGSSSSILTSRNVMTLTLLTNRAGRYMSHTHASFNSNSK